MDMDNNVLSAGGREVLDDYMVMGKNTIKIKF